MGAISLARDLRYGKTKSAFDVLRGKGPVKLVPCEKHSVSLQPRWRNAGLNLVATLGIGGCSQCRLGEATLRAAGY